MTDEKSLLPVWKALADPKRRQLIELLEEKPRTTSELCESFDVSRFAIMKHLNVLGQAGLITFRREGRHRWNILNDELIQYLPSSIDDEVGNGGYQLSEILGLFPGKPARESIPPATTIIIEQEYNLSGTPDEVYQALTTNIDRWWSHRSWPESGTIILEPRLNGRFYETFGEDGQGELYSTVILARKGKELRFNGAMGITDRATISFVRILLEAQKDGSLLQITHRLFGEVDADLSENIADRWKELLGLHLKSFIEEGVTYRDYLKTEKVNGRELSP